MDLSESLPDNAAGLSKHEPRRKACAVSCENDHRCSISAHTRYRLDNQKWAYFYSGRNGNVNTLIRAQRISPCTALDHCTCLHYSIHSVGLGQTCCLLAGSVLQQRRPACQILLNKPVDYSLSQVCCCRECRRGERGGVMEALMCRTEQFQVPVERL